MLWQRRQILWLRNAHITAGGAVYRIPHNDQAIKHQAGTGSPPIHPPPTLQLPHLRFLQGKNITRGKYKMPSSKQIRLQEWQVS